MCTDCGCAVTPGKVEIHSHSHEPHDHAHDHHDHHHHHGDRDHTHTLPVHQAILAKNDRLAERNRGYFLAKGLLVLNVLSSPGSGKTTLIQRTLSDLGERLPAGVIVGDLATDNDAQRLRETGAPVVQITTGSICHLEADMIAQAIAEIPLDKLQLLIIENVGNLVCPAAYDLGENLRVAMLSTTEGEDKPLKYPTLFKSADVILLNKTDIAEVVGFDREVALKNLQQVAPQAQIIEVSARSGFGLEQWYGYLEEQFKQIAPQLVHP
ncbi:hydrogenase nickel incorporation protein HypB [Roseofilum sp. BLCC_M154]|uniref:Hydrogenase nickel incorporation protein HypB n=1 Tax=Roseofilum acuticapitatum BLCC-M154 TaxID=3022444 RepID=A0ABT7ARY1_9CYAN|nr:hydrogenase nickel incorporation protein HypB [Roseofilum acuticapitatum]MDJ1169662.1 hydrogenase nickel incorporation protein HypB [Roseofilum acuticapitatum BLCC-M154]